jgi:cyclophilin family peptidyl-prolyl cis-trans isomerase
MIRSLARPSAVRVAAIALVGLVAVAGCVGGQASTTLPPVGSPAPAESMPPAASEAPSASSADSSPTTGPNGCPTSEPAPLGKGERRTVTIETPKGTIVIELTGDLSPIATGNFVALAACGWYDGVVFHRVVPGFVIQGGDVQYGRTPMDPELVGTGGPGYTITDDPVTTPYGRGTLAMARTPAPNSQGSQFFVVLDDQAKAALESANTYAILGTVVSGLDVVDAIAAMSNSGEPANQALEPVAITKATVSRR